MNKYSDAILFEVELEDQHKVKKIYSAGPRTFDQIEKINKIADKWAAKEKEAPHNMNEINKNYETFACIFNVPIAEVKKYGSETILKVITDYVNNAAKNALAQGEPIN